MGKREVRKNRTRKQTGGFGVFGINLFGTGNTTQKSEEQQTPEKGGVSFFSPSSWFSSKKADTETNTTADSTTDTSTTADSTTADSTTNTSTTDDSKDNNTEDSSVPNQAGGKRKSKRSNKQKNKKTKKRRKCKGKKI